MLKIFKQLEKIWQGSLFRLNNKTQQALVSKNELLDLLLQVKSNKKTDKYKNEVAFKQAGDIRSIYRGYGMDYEESRRYQPGDDPRYMNWQLSARTGQHYMKVFREERQLGVFILVDRRHSMRFGTRKRLKITQAVRAAAIATFSAQENNYSIGGVILDDNIEWFKESKSKQAAFNFINQAARPISPSYKKKSSESGFGDILRMLNEILTSGSIVYLISDFHDLNEKSQSTLLQLSSSHQIRAIQISDLAEIDLPKAGNVTLKDSIFGVRQQLNSNSLHQQEKYKVAAKEYFSVKKSLFKDIVIPHQTILTTDDYINEKIIF